MKIYAPVLVTTAQEVEALPDGTHFVVLYGGEEPEAPLIFVKLHGDIYDFSSEAFLLPSDIVPITALVEQEVAEIFEDTEYGNMLEPHEQPEEGVDRDALYRRITLNTPWKRAEG